MKRSRSKVTRFSGHSCARSVGPRSSVEDSFVVLVGEQCACAVQCAVHGSRQIHATTISKLTIRVLLSLRSVVDTLLKCNSMGHCSVDCLYNTVGRIRRSRDNSRSSV